MTRASGPARPFVLCADDYAIAEGVSRGILELMADGRISATSAMTNRPLWPRLARELQPFEQRAAIGLHLNLTLGRPLGPMPLLAAGGEFPRLADLMRRAFTGRLSAAEVRTEIRRQLDAFAAALGRPPDFIDGHGHVHVLPGVRSSLLAVLSERGLNQPWLRDPSDQAAAILRRGAAPLKSLIIAGLATGFGRAARRAGLSTNRGFSGASPFDPARDFGADFARFLVAPGPRHLVMCHPGRIDDDLASFDPIAQSREQELSFLASTRFPEMCAAANLRPAPSWT